MKNPDTFHAHPSDGNVGIGSSTPYEKLDVNGNISFGATNHVAANLYWDSSISGFRYKKDGYGGALDFFGNGGLTLIVADENKSGVNADATGKLRNAITISSNGAVGIGTSNPSSDLQINGYVQLAVTGGGAPTILDCDEVNEYGRMKVDEVNALLYICTTSGWVSK